MRSSGNRMVRSRSGSALSAQSPHDAQIDIPADQPALLGNFQLSNQQPHDDTDEIDELAEAQPEEATQMQFKSA